MTHISLTQIPLFDALTRMLRIQSTHISVLHHTTNDNNNCFVYSVVKMKMTKLRYAPKIAHRHLGTEAYSGLLVTGVWERRPQKSLNHTLKTFANAEKCPSWKIL